MMPFLVRFPSVLALQRHASLFFFLSDSASFQEKNLAVTLAVSGYSVSQKTLHSAALSKKVLPSLSTLRLSPGWKYWVSSRRKHSSA